MPATPVVPTTNIKSLTVGTARTPGKITIFNGTLEFVSGDSLTDYRMRISSENIIIHDGTNPRVGIGKFVGRF